MRVRSAPPPATAADLLDAFRHQLMARDLAPATIQAYVHDLARFHVARVGPRGRSTSADPSPDY